MSLSFANVEDVLVILLFDVDVRSFLFVDEFKEDDDDDDEVVEEEEEDEDEDDGELARDGLFGDKLAAFNCCCCCCCWTRL